MTDQPPILHDIVITPTAVYVDGEPMPYLIDGDHGPLGTLEYHGQLAYVTVRLIARRAEFRTDLAEGPKMTQAEARDIFAARNPSAFGGTSA